MNWMKTINIRYVLLKDTAPHSKADEILLILADNVKESEMNEAYDNVAHGFALVKSQEDLDHALEALYKWATENMVWLG